MIKGNRRKSIGAIGALFVMTILMTATITTAMAYDLKPCGCGNEDIKVVALKGAEANQKIAETFSNEEVKVLREKMIRNGLTLERDNIETKRVTALYNNNYIRDCSSNPAFQHG